MAEVASTAQFVDAFQSFASNGASGAPDWLKALRQRGIDRFTDRGFPTTKEEKWRFTSVKPIVQSSFHVAESGAVRDEDVQANTYDDQEAIRLVFVNGRLSESQSSASKLPRGVVVSDLSAALATHTDVVKQHLGQYVSLEDNSFAALNTAFTAHGAFVYVPKGVVVERDIQVLYVTVAGDVATMTHPRNLIVIDDGAQARFIETYLGLTDSTYLTNCVTEIVVGDNARLDCYRVQRESDAAFHVATTNSVQGRDSWYALTAVPFGAALSRHDIRMVMNGEGGEGRLNGLYVMRDKQHVDHNTVIEHAVPHCNSFEYFNGILDEKAHAVFNGRIIVHPGAQKTDSKQTNNNLLLSEDARADSQPQLEIYADDVRCTHGATLGPLDDNALFYLRSRGIDADAARAILTYGFGVEILERMESTTVRDYLEPLIKERLEAQMAGVG